MSKTAAKDASVRGNDVGRFFDEWALSGRHESMEKGHAESVYKFLGGVDFTTTKQFSFLDVGCGNGWVVRHVAKKPGCILAVGIDKSPQMIRLARSVKSPGSKRYANAGVESYRGGPFDYVFSMESIYYAESVRDALGAVWRLLKPGGRFFCGTDYYLENKATAKWKNSMGVHMHLLSRRRWKRLFEDAGFMASTRMVRTAAGPAWKRTAGTLFISGLKQPIT